MTRFPVLDPEPPPRSARQILKRSAIVLAALVVLAAAGLGVRAIFGSSSKSGGPSGSVLVQATSGLLAQARPDGTHQLTLNAGGFLGGQGGFFISPDGHYLITAQGALLSLDDGRPGKSSTVLFNGMSTAGEDSIVTASEPFVDGDKAVVFSASFNDHTGQSKIYELARGGGKPLSLGSGLNYTGDPAAAAIYVEQTTPDGSIDVVHRSVGGHVTIIATSTELDQVLGLPSSLTPGVFITPSDDGSRLALDVESSSGGGVVVVSRSGQVEAHSVGRRTGPLFWSGSGNELLDTTAAGLQLWKIGSNPQLLPLTASRMLEVCAWSPNGHHVACASYSGPGSAPIRGWLLIDVATGTARAFPSAGLPLLWVGAG